MCDISIPSKECPAPPCAEFENDAAAKVTELATLLDEREEEFYSYQQSSADTDEDYDDEEEDVAPGGSKPKKMDEIDYAEDEDEDYENKDEM